MNRRGVSFVLRALSVTAPMAMPAVGGGSESISATSTSFTIPGYRGPSGQAFISDNGSRFWHSYLGTGIYYVDYVTSTALDHPLTGAIKTDELFPPIVCSDDALRGWILPLSAQAQPEVTFFTPATLNQPLTKKLSFNTTSQQNFVSKDAKRVWLWDEKALDSQVYFLTSAMMQNSGASVPHKELSFKSAGGCVGAFSLDGKRGWLWEINTQYINIFFLTPQQMESSGTIAPRASLDFWGTYQSCMAGSENNRKCFI